MTVNEIIDRFIVADMLIDAVTSVLGNPLRSSLTIIGIVIGIAAVVVVTAVGEGNRALIQEKIKKMGANLVVIDHDAAHYNSDTLSAGRPEFVDEATIQKLDKKFRSVEAISPLLSLQTQGRFNGNTITLILNGTYSSYTKVRRMKVLHGRYFSSTENVYGRRVCVLNRVAYQALFPGSSATLNREINIDGRNYRLIGVVEDMTYSDTEAQTERAYIPYAVMKTEWPYMFLSKVYLTVDKHASVENTMQKIKLFLQQKYGVKSRDWVSSMSKLLQTQKSLTERASMLIIAVASLSLFVGGVGIMNVLLVTIKERTREIGIRKALGAKDHEILRQFLFEGVFLCCVGGVLGILTGILVIALLNVVFVLPAKISLFVVFIAVSFAALVGVIFSLYPAINAAKLSPVQSLQQN